MKRKPAAKAGNPPKSKGKAKPKTPTPKATRPSSAVVLSADQQVDKLNDALPQARRLVEAMKVAKSNFDTYCAKLEKNSGVTKKRVKLALLCDTAEGETKIKDDLVEILWVANAVGSKVPQQLNLFPKTTAAQDAYAAGRRASDGAARPPTELSQSMAQHWLRGHAEGREAKNVGRLEGFKPLGVVADSIAGSGAGAVDSLTEDREAA